MSALLSFEQAPPLSAPMRCFLIAPLFAVLAGVLLLYSGPELFFSRWSPAALALTHLITAGFMLGAMQQLLPVAVGANFPRPRLIATLVHASITPGALLLAAAFLTSEPLLFAGAVACLATGVSISLVAAVIALRGSASTHPTILGFKLSLFGLCVTVLSGVLLAVSLGLSLDLPWPSIEANGGNRHRHGERRATTAGVGMLSGADLCQHVIVAFAGPAVPGAPVSKPKKGASTPILTLT